MKPFCEQLSEVRKRRGMTQDCLAATMNITRQGVSRWENGRSLPDAETLKRLSHVLSYDFIANKEIQPTLDESPMPKPEAPEPEAPETEQAGGSVENLTLALDEPAPRKYKNVLRCALCLAVGLIVGCLMGVYAFPHTTQEHLLSASVDASKQASAQATYRPEIMGEACLSISATENPVKAVHMSDGAAAWMYTVVVKNMGELSFTVEQVEQQAVADDGTLHALSMLSAADMGWGDGVILSGSKVSFGGGFPVQPIKGVHVKVYGKDEKGQALAFEGEVNLSKEIAE